MSRIHLLAGAAAPCLLLAVPAAAQAQDASSVTSDAAKAPAFIAGAADDEYQSNDPVLLYTAWRKAGAAVELHLYERGGHGFDLYRQGTTSDQWFDHLLSWMTSRNLVTPERASAQ